uniref:Uncharacterized protein n=1 Tax=Aegilops tauschii TaxID=37682 RepID=M8C7D7_AEGTA
MDKSSDELYQRTVHGREETPDVVHLTHLTTPDSLLHLRLGFTSVASAPLSLKSSASALVARPLAALASLLGRGAFRSESNRMGELNIEDMVHVEEGWLRGQAADRQASGAAVLTLGLLNQAST